MQSTSFITSIAVQIMHLLDHLHQFTLQIDPIDYLDVWATSLGWTYFIAWTISFYPQVFTNYKRKSVIGFSFDLVALNLIGYIGYSIFNCSLYYSSSIRNEFMLIYNVTTIPVESNDVFFSLHATFITIFIIGQCIIYEKGNQNVSWLSCLFIIITVSISLSIFIQVRMHKVSDLFLLYYLSYIKLIVTSIKYIPQAYLNYIRKSTIGWDIKSILLDAIGGVLSIMQMILIAANRSFGIYLGKLQHLNKLTVELRKQIFDKLYHNLHLRLFRTEYPSSFSLEPNIYSIDCIDELTCGWIKVHRLIRTYPNISLFATIWSPPQYMKDKFSRLKKSHELNYYYYVQNITSLINREFSLFIYPISLANEPENFLVNWDHCVFTPKQLCSLIDKFNDDRFRICPETSYFFLAKTYISYRDWSVNCLKTCKIVATHAYKPNLMLFSSDLFQVSYDTTRYENTFNAPLWLTEVSSTYLKTYSDQMDEALDFAENIINFVGYSCVQRYYYWLAFTIGTSGESLIWGNETLILPKKYWAFRHFTLASNGGNNIIRECSIDDLKCISFDGKKVFLNRGDAKAINMKTCCTTSQFNYGCGIDDFTPITGNPTKLGLGLVSLVFDVIFIIQHYILYKFDKKKSQLSVHLLNDSDCDGYYSE